MHAIWPGKRASIPTGGSPLKKHFHCYSTRNTTEKTKYGYARGSEPISYVKRILIYYDILKHQDIQYPVGEASRDMGMESTARF